jgi:anti-sigma factor ChrR (cupin superfamily)
MTSSLYVEAGSQKWRDSPYPGVRWAKLRYDPSTGESAVLLRFDPGSAYGTHRHPAGEQYLVLEGSLEDGGKAWGEGAYVWHPPGSIHTPRSKKGCLLFVALPKPIEIVEEAPPSR